MTGNLKQSNNSKQCRLDELLSRTVLVNIVCPLCNSKFVASVNYNRDHVVQCSHCLEEGIISVYEIEDHMVWN
jgi:hypothetical protein